MNENKGRMPTKIELTLEQSQQGVSNDVLSKNSGNVGRNNRRAYVQGEVVEGMNATNETANVQRIVQTPTPGNTSTGQCYNCGGKGHYARNCPKPRVRDSKYFMEQMLLAKQDEAGGILTDEQNDFLFADASRMEEIEELSANICLMARIQPADQNSDDEPSYESAFVSEVQSSSINENDEQMYPTHTKIINSTIDDDQINSNIQFDSVKGNVNSGSVEKDTHVYDLCALETIARECNMLKLAKQQTILLRSILNIDIELTVCCLNHECVDESLHDELEQVKKKSLEIQEGLRARIKILEKAVQRCETQSVDFELKLQHEKEKQKWDSSKNKNSKPLDFSWISRIQKLEDENVSLDFKVQSLIKERDNAKMEYKKLFDSIKKTRSQTQKEMDELIAHVSEKTYAYGAIRAENQNLLVTISELKARMKNGEHGKSVNTKFDKTHGSQSFICVTPLIKNAFQKQTVVLKTKENHVESKPVTLQTSHTKQTGTHQNTNVISPGMYRVVTQQESQTNKSKNVLSSTGMNATSSVTRPKSR
ncbi:retrovirus-related pol polyprotein from transposon TNT 1-94 [Tanacetum coccineum]